MHLTDQSQVQAFKSCLDLFECRITATTSQESAVPATESIMYGEFARLLYRTVRSIEEQGRYDELAPLLTRLATRLLVYRLKPERLSIAVRIALPNNAWPRDAHQIWQHTCL